MSAMKLYYWPVLARASHSLLILCWTEQKYEFVTPEWPGTLVFPFFAALVDQVHASHALALVGAASNSSF